MFKSPRRGRLARQYASRLCESSQRLDAYLEEQHRGSSTQFSACVGGACENSEVQQLRTLVKAATWLSAEARPGGAEPEAILALLFLSHNRQLAVFQLYLRCVRALAAKMRGTDRPNATVMEEEKCFSLLITALSGLLSALFLARGVHLPNAVHIMETLALKLGVLPTSCELLAVLAAVKPMAAQHKMRLEEVELVLATLKFPLSLLTQTFSWFKSDFIEAPTSLLVLLPQAVASSHFVEHSARVLTLAFETFVGPQATEPSGSAPTDKQLRQDISNDICLLLCCVSSLSTFYKVQTLQSLKGIYISADLEARMLAAIRAILSGPCLQYALAGSIVGTLAAVDGGTLYGMTTPLALSKGILPSIFKLWSSPFEQSPPVQLSLYSPRAVRQVCLRTLNVARMSVGSNAAAQRMEAEGGLQQPQPLGQVSLPGLLDRLLPRNSVNLALEALRCYAFMCPYPLVRSLRAGGGIWTGPSTTTNTPAAAEAAVEYWSAAVATLSTFFGSFNASADTDLARVLVSMDVAVGDWTDGEPVPPPSPSLTAALAAGYVPLLERLLRAFLPDISQPQGHGLAPSLCVFGDRSRMAALLSHGDPHEVASLLATGAKLLRRLGHTEPTLEHVRALQSLVTDWMWTFLNDRVEEMSAGSAEGAPFVAGGPSSSTAQQPGGEALGQATWLISTCLPLWLHSLVALTSVPILDFLSMKRFMLGVIQCLRWVPALMAAMEMEEGRLQLAGCNWSSGGHGTVNGKCRGFGWRRFLMQQWGLMGQLGICLQMMAFCNMDVAREEYPVMLEMTYTALNCIVSVLPGEVAACVQDGRIPTPTPEQLFRGAGIPQQAGLEKWRVLLSRLRELKKLKNAKGEVKESAVDDFWAAMPTSKQIGSMLLRANCPAAASASTSEGTQASSSHGRLHGQPPLPLRLCANPDCDNLEGDSEATLPLKACASCGAVWYCGRECQTAHWRAGHKTECGTLRTQSQRPVGS